jgi:hypothetical protein
MVNNENLKYIVFTFYNFFLYDDYRKKGKLNVLEII